MSTFPQPWISTVSHWQGTNRGPGSLWLHNKTGRLPETADIVIVGAGMMGSALSYFLTRPGAHGEGKRIVCLDAKDCGSGASGRNGGHVGPKTYHKWAQLMEPYPTGIGCSEEESTWVFQNERDNLDLVESIIRTEKLDVDFWRGELLETHHSKEQTETCKRQNAAWMKAREAVGLQPNPDTSFIDDPEEAERLSRFKGVTSVHVRPGGSVHSHKLCSALMRLAIESTASDFSFYSWAPVNGFPAATPSGQRVVKTSRGDILTDRVILCTNAHTPNFFSKDDPLHTHIQPLRGQCALITPPPTYSGDQSFKHTYNMVDEHYLVQTPSGGIVLGGGLRALIRDGKVKFEDSYGAVNDSGDSVEPAQTEHLGSFLRDNFVGWGPEGHGEGLTRTWTGILSTVKDWLPLVGDVPGKTGVSMCAGFAGHGMSRIFAVAQGYSDTLKSGTWDAKLLPRSFELTAERLKRTADWQAEYEAAQRSAGRQVDPRLVFEEDKYPTEPTNMVKGDNGAAVEVKIVMTDLRV
ncbi:FAD dependent oxidoreductase-domain-containing protein [Naematelia encephala]|uniref:FAD dependent oxidoreductase-domain-containing protein n=1 Tax=Naematelia encephala TaxID=71784 RepID=A0A1Y2B8B6_9TREE|nr:FAD dependent oxidoreductase-domain-containing protein [Naematelia encephala]